MCIIIEEVVVCRFSDYGGRERPASEAGRFFEGLAHVHLNFLHTANFGLTLPRACSDGSRAVEANYAYRLFICLNIFSNISKVPSAG